MCVVRGLHQFGAVKENVLVDEVEVFIHIAVLVNHRPCGVVVHGAVKSVGGFGVHQNVEVAVHGSLPLSLFIAFRHYLL